MNPFSGLLILYPLSESGFTGFKDFQDFGAMGRFLHKGDCCVVRIADYRGFKGLTRIKK